MKKSKVVKIESEQILFDNGIKLSSNHNQDCCESRYLQFEHLTLSDFDGLEFDLTGDDFFKRIEGYGIELIPIKGFSVRVPGYASNNGYYSDNLDLVLTDANGKLIREYDITECQKYED
jgi:hypothetical protein